MMALNQAITEQAGATLLKRAVELDQQGRYTESLMHYESGIKKLLEVLKTTNDEVKKKHFRDRITQYMDRAEKLKDHVDKEKEAGKYHEQIKIDSNAVGFGYDKIFKRFVDSSLTEVEVEDPYIRSIHQIYNFLRLCELLVTSDAKIQRIKLITGKDDSSESQRTQQARLTEVSQSLQHHGVTLDVDFSATLHDREIRFNNGWIIKIGRGLDYFKPSPGKFMLGYCDYNLRPCHETTVDIFHKKSSNFR